VARRFFLVELDQKIKDDSVGSFLKPADPTRLTRDAGYIQGLTDAKNLFEAIASANQKERDEQ
jgi:hypothetical protein